MASARPVPQLTLTAEEGSGARELVYEEAEALNGGAPLRRKLSTSSVSSTGSSVGLEESEDDILSDNETKSKGIVTLEHLGDGGEVGYHESCCVTVHSRETEGFQPSGYFESLVVLVGQRDWTCRVMFKSGFVVKKVEQSGFSLDKFPALIVHTDI